MTPPTTDERSNADIRGVIDAATKPTVSFAFAAPELVKQFEPHDRRANGLKWRSRVSGLLAVGMVLAALLLASVELSRGGTHDEASLVREAIAAGLGLAGTILGLRAYFNGSSKRQWLRARLFTESVRQFHFQWIVTHLEDIADAANDSKKQDAYVQTRDQAAAAFIAELTRSLDAWLDHIVAGEIPRSTVLGQIVAQTGAAATGTPPTDALQAYRAARLDYQRRYAESKTALEQSSLFSPRRQERYFSILGWTCVVVIVGIHVVHLAGHWVEVPAYWLNLAVIWIALIALAGHATEDGLQPQREVERYEQYGASCRAALERFDLAKDVTQSIEVMNGFEAVSAEEMRVFLRVHNRARFVL